MLKKGENINHMATLEKAKKNVFCALLKWNGVTFPLRNKLLFVVTSNHFVTFKIVVTGRDSKKMVHESFFY